MDLIEYSKAGNPVLYFPDGAGSGRLAAEVFRINGGVAVVDSGWSEPMNSTHPFHVLEGELKEFSFDQDGDPVYNWSVGSAILRELLDFMDVQAGAWEHWKASEHRLPRARALRALREVFPEIEIIKEGG